MKRKPLAFMSYCRADDERDHGRLTQWREQLSAEVRTYTGDEFPILQDRNDIAWGQNWQEWVRDSLNEVTFLIPIVTPGFFKSDACRDELSQFLEREKTLGPSDLVLPLYYVDCPLLNDEEQRAQDELAGAIAAHQYADWRDLRFEPFTSPQVARQLAQLAMQIRDALERVRTEAKITVPRPTPAVSHDAARGDVATLPPPPADSTQPGEEPVGARPSAKTEPPTHLVDPLYRGDYVTISEAIAAANPGDKILVRPGLYAEGLTLRKPLEIIGDGDPGDVVVAASGADALLFETTMGRVVNLTFRQVGGGKWCGVHIAQGRLDVEGCDITSNGSACVAIHAGADPRLRRNRIHDGESSGVFVYDNGQGVLEDNDIFGNAKTGVEIRTGSNLTLRRNRIHAGKQSGVFVYDNGQGVLEDNDIFGNAKAGVEIRRGSNLTLRRNRIHDGKSGGVLVHENGEGALEDNDIFGNALAGVGITTGGNPTLRRNRIHDGKSVGAFVYDNGQGTLEDNDIFGNASFGVAIETGGNPTLRRNRIHDGKSVGAFVYDNGQGVLEDNDIFGNASFGVAIKTGGNPTLRRNRINRNAYEAVLVYDGGAGVVEDNDLRDNKGGAWDISADSEPKLKRARNLERPPVEQE